MNDATSKLNGKRRQATEETIAERFRVGYAPTLLTSSPSRSPITISHLRCDEENHGPNRHAPVEDAYVTNVILKDLSADIWLEGKRAEHRSAGRGGLYIFDLQSDPVVDFKSSFELVRFYITRKTLDELSRDAGITSRGSLDRPPLGSFDPVMHSLARAMMPALRSPDEVNQLYVDYVSRAFHAHLMSHYAGRGTERRKARPGLAAWQARASTELIAARLDGKVSVSELAAVCNISESHFSRAFFRTFGVPPHRWLLEQRVQRAKALIETGHMTLSDVAIHAGFASQSHLTRVFAAVTGTTPGKWRRMASRCGGIPSDFADG